MIYPFTRFDFKFGEHKVAADYEDVDGILYFTFTIDGRIEVSVRILQSIYEHFVEIDRIHYGELLNDERPPQSSFKRSGLPLACVEQVMRKHPELRFVFRSELSNAFALNLGRELARRNLLFIIF